MLIQQPKGLVYYSENPFESEAAKPRGFIDFGELNEAKPHHKVAERFMLVTVARKWHFKAQHLDERNEWLSAATQLHESKPIEPMIEIEDSKTNESNLIALDEFSNGNERANLGLQIRIDAPVKADEFKAQMDDFNKKMADLGSQIKGNIVKRNAHPAPNDGKSEVP